MSYHQLPITANFFFLIFFFLIKTSEQHTAADLVNFVYYPTGFVWSHRLHQGFNKMNKIELRIYWTFTVQITFKLRWKLQKTPTNRKCYANPAQQTGNVTQIQRNKLSNVYFFIFGIYVKSWAPNAKFDTLYGYQFTLSTKLIKPNDPVILLTDAAQQFFLEIHPLLTCYHYCSSIKHFWKLPRYFIVKGWLE